MRQWTKSSYSGAREPDCVECRIGDAEHVNMRDSQHPHLNHLAIPAPEWNAFLHAVRHDEL